MSRVIDTGMCGEKILQSVHCFCSKTSQFRDNLTLVSSETIYVPIQKQSLFVSSSTIQYPIQVAIFQSKFDGKLCCRDMCKNVQALWGESMATNGFHSERASNAGKCDDFIVIIWNIHTLRLAECVAVFVSFLWQVGHNKFIWKCISLNLIISFHTLP